MAERPDIVGEEAAEAMKGLHNTNPPFPNELAFRTILEDLDWQGPLAASLPGVALGGDGAPLFESFGNEPVAAASLGQVCNRPLHRVVFIRVSYAHIGSERLRYC
eukprot:5676644-Pyramimonas_sp.AAC.1